MYKNSQLNLVYHIYEDYKGQENYIHNLNLRFEKSITVQRPFQKEPSFVLLRVTDRYPKRKTLDNQILENQYPVEYQIIIEVTHSDQEIHISSIPYILNNKRSAKMGRKTKNEKEEKLFIISASIR